FIPAAAALYGLVPATYGRRTERMPGYMQRVIDYYRVGPGEVAIIFNNIGVNSGTLDAALACKEKGAYTIGVAGSPWQKEIPKDHYTRHPSRKNLMDVVDLFIDDYNPVGDSVIEIDGFDRPIAPISGVTDAYIVREMEIQAVKYMVSKGFTPPIYMSANRVGGDEANEKLINKYFNRIKLL
ncbi:MAG: SIS domain-containing protein, partial [Spirochaetota bacterium]